MGQAHGEGLKSHPHHTDPHDVVWALAYRFGLDPARLLAMPAHHLAAFNSYCVGRDRGRAIAAGR